MLAAGGRQESPEAEPVLLRKSALGNGDEAAKSRLGGQEVVEAGVKTMAGDVVADRAEVSRLVIQKVVVEVRHFPATRCEVLDLRESLAGAPTRFNDRVTQLREPRMLREGTADPARAGWPGPHQSTAPSWNRTSRRRGVSDIVQAPKNRPKIAQSPNLLD